MTKPKGKGTRRRTTTVEEVEPPVTPEEEFGLIEEDDLPPSIENVLAEIGDDVARVVLYRRLKGERQAYVGTLDADEFSLDVVARTWGGGRYVARFSGTAGGFLKGKPGVTFYIDESLKPEPKAPAGALGGGTGNAVTDTLMSKLLDRALTPVAPVDPAAIATAIATASSAQLTAMMAAVAPLLGKLTEISAGGSGRGGAAAGDILSAVELGIGLGGKDDGYLPVIKEVGVPLINALERMMEQRHPARALPASGAGGAAAPDAAATEKPWVAAIRPYVGKIIGFARNQDEPSLWAAVLDRQYPKFAKWLENAVLNPAFENELLLQFPDLAPYQEWVHRFLAEFETEEEPPTPSGVGDGNPDA